MNIEDIKVGCKYNIVGNKGFCSHNTKQRCNDCGDFKKGIIVTAVNRGVKNNQGVSGTALVTYKDYDGIPAYNRCNFCPEDLELMEIDWANEI